MGLTFWTLSQRSKRRPGRESSVCWHVFDGRRSQTGRRPKLTQSTDQISVGTNSSQPKLGQLWCLLFLCVTSLKFFFDSVVVFVVLVCDITKNVSILRVSFNITRAVARGPTPWAIRREWRGVCEYYPGTSPVYSVMTRRPLIVPLVTR
jgi:hypothetical protein